MAKVIDYAERCFKVKCDHCNATLVFADGDIWWDNYVNGIGRVECPICRTEISAKEIQFDATDSGLSTFV